MIDDPWVWEDFGGPIPCEEPDSGGPPVACGAQASVQVDRQALVTWEQMQAAEPSDSGLGAVFDHPPLSQGESGTLPEVAEAPEEGPGSSLLGGCDETGPTLGLRFQGASRPETSEDLPPNGSGPPDTMGAIGPGHFLEVINGNVSIFDKASGYRLRSLRLHSFFSAVRQGDHVYDPRVLFDLHSGRWVVAAADGEAGTVFGFVLAVSRSGDPAGAWFQLRVGTGGPR